MTGLRRALGGLLALLTLLLLVDSAWLAATSSTGSLERALVRAHLVLGGALLLVLPAFVWAHVAHRERHANVQARRAGLRVAALAGLGAVSGSMLWLLGKSTAMQWLATAHALAFAAALLAYLLHRRQATVTPALLPEKVAAALGLVLASALGLSRVAAPPAAPAEPLVVGLTGAATVDGHVLSAAVLTDTDYCAQCHEEVAERWAQSAHRFSSLNDPFYAATLAVSQAHREPAELGFCGGCHDPALVFTGTMAKSHPRPGEPLTEEGIPCLGCHAIVEQPGRLGNGSYVLAAPAHYPGYGSDDPDEQEENRRLIRSRPEQHIASFAPPHLRTSELCVGCHKAHIPAALNRHRRVAGQNDYDPWFGSGAGANSARTFFPPKGPKRCAECHMPRIAADDPAARDGTVADHGFPGANTALPSVLDRPEWLARNQAFLAEVLTADIGAVRVLGDAPRDVLAPGPEVAVPPGAPLEVDVVVRNVGAGHLFPGGIADLREAWLEVTVQSEDGVLLASGWLDADGHLDPAAHRWHAVLLDREGRRLAVHEVEETHAVLYARRIMLGASDVVRVSLEAPSGPATLTARVLHRKFPRDYVTFALGDDAPRLPVTELARAEVRLGSEDSPAEDRGPRLRNLGVAHLLRGDTVAARVAAAGAAELLPDDPGPHLDQARAALADGALDSVEPHLRAADQRAPGHPTTAWLLGRLEAARGEHERAIAAFDRALAAFPRDREVLAAKGESLFRLERDEEAAAVLEEVLTLDPEHLAAHALLTRIRDGQGQAEAADRHQRLWDEVRPHSADRSVAETARRDDPHLDRRSNQQYVLPLEQPTEGSRPAL